MADFFRHIFSSDSFMPHGHCYLWKPSLVWLQVLSNGAIGLSYVAISSTLAYLVYRIRDLPFQWIYLAFGLFIITCGLTHFLDIWTIWTPIYWADGFVRSVTAIASAVTACVLPFLIPKAISLAHGSKLAHDRGIKLEIAYQELGRVFEKTKELDELKTQFFANVSHELRTPLTLILGPTDKLRQADNLTEDQKQDLEVVSRNAKVLLKHVNDLLDVAKLEAGRMVPSYAEVDFRKLIRLVSNNFDGLAREKNIDFVIETSDFILLQIDPDMIQRVFLNLLSNAFKFVPMNGKVKVHVEKKNSHVLFYVQDNGPGVPADQRLTIFERFRQGDGKFTRRFGGTGLGLSIAEELVKLHHGLIQVTDAPEGGARFTVKLPVCAPQGARVRKLSEATILEESAKQTVLQLMEDSRRMEALVPAASAGEKGTVLVVEDNPDLNRYLVKTLSARYRVVTAFDGREGLQEIAKIMPDLVLSDIMMPGMSGDQMLVEMRKSPQFDSIPIVFLTAKADDELRIKLLQEGAQDYVTKPFSAEEILARVKHLVIMKRAVETLQRELSTHIHDLETLATDIAESKRDLQTTVEDLRVTKKELQRLLSLRDEFISVAAHELRTPLTPIILRTQILEYQLRKGAFSASTQEGSLVDFVDTSKRQLIQLSKLVDNLLDLSRIQLGRFNLDLEVTSDLSELVQSVIQMYQVERGGTPLKVESHCQSHVEGIWDRLKIEQVILNLLTNAIKYGEGKLIQVNVDADEKNAKIKIQDHGMGIKTEDLERIFERFARAVSLDKFGGLGLGLYIARQIVDAHGGSITVESTFGSGATFTVSLPLKPPTIGVKAA